MDTRAVVLLCLLCVLFPSGADAISTGTPDGSERWGYVETRPNVKMFWLWYRSPQRVSTPARPWPTVLWLQGGPGGSGVGHGNFLEIGPLDVNLQPRQWTWLKVADLIFVDAPVGVGYSYTENPSALVRTDSQAVKDLAVIVESLLNDELPALEHSPMYIVGESYGGKHAAMLGVSLSRAIRAGTLKLTLGGVLLGDSWISPADFSLSYAQLLHYVSRLNDNAVADVNKMAVMVKEQMLAGQYATARQTFTDQLDLIDSQTDSVNMNNFLLDAGMNLVLTDSNLKTNSSSNRTTEESGSAPNNTIDGDMNGPIKKMFKLIPKGLFWQEASIDVYDALVNDFMKPAIEQVDELLSHGVNVTVYQGQLDVICSTIGAEAWVRKLKWSGLRDFLSLRRKPLHFCDSAIYCSKEIKAYVRSYKNFEFYWILEAGHMVPVDQPYTAFRMIARVTQSAGII
ncbi:hypothetical protein SEVIR_7G029200v4 [Setaria viridis]|nr:serine carboxypeptidase-like 51 isoform X1 [Setaria italica]XP_034602187.1 serine carboxypeptidase-like 51 isoform X3 [Setaria viridis]